MTWIKLRNFLLMVLVAVLLGVASAQVIAQYPRCPVGICCPGLKTTNCEATTVGEVCDDETIALVGLAHHITPKFCLDWDGTGHNRYCTANGACCQRDGACMVQSAAVCLDAGGTYFGHGSLCSSTDRNHCMGACCQPPVAGGDDECKDFHSINTCETAGGSFLGFGSSCNSTVPLFCACNALDLNPLGGPYSYEGNTYWILEKRNYADAEQTARCLGGHLVILDDVNEDKWVQHRFVNYDPRWLGYNGRWIPSVQTAWRDALGQEIVYENWCETEPCDARFGRYAALGEGAVTHWEDVKDDMDRYVIVEARGCDAAGGLTATYQYVGMEKQTYPAGERSIDPVTGPIISRVDAVIDFNWTETSYQVFSQGWPLPSDRTCLSYSRLVEKIDPSMPQKPDLKLSRIDVGDAASYPCIVSAERFNASWSGFVRVDDSELYVFYLTSGVEDCTDSGCTPVTTTLRVRDSDAAAGVYLIDEAGGSAPFGAISPGNGIIAHGQIQELFAGEFLEAGKLYEIEITYNNFGTWVEYNGTTLCTAGFASGSVVTRVPFIRLEWKTPWTDRKVIPPNNLLPKSLEGDCNGNTVSDACDIANCPRDSDCVENCPRVDPLCVANCRPDPECVADCPVEDPSCADCDCNNVPDGCQLLAECPPGATCDLVCKPNVNCVANCTDPCCIARCPLEDQMSVCITDCDDNGVLDVCERGDDWDCNDNKIWDECERNETTDCNDNDVLDECELSLDCQADFLTANEHCDQDAVDDLVKGVPDDCELDLNDFNRNGIPDDCDICNGLIIDCNRNTYPDRCELPTTTDPVCDTVPKSDDCNGNRVPDECEIDMDRGDDFFCDSDVDSCDPDCNHNGVLDSCDVSDRTSADCDDNTVPDECEISVLDGGDCIIAKGFFDPVAGRTFGCDSDCNGNGKVDICDIPVSEKGKCTAASCAASDCDGNGTPDVCDIRTGEEQDCNNNITPDKCEIMDGLASDCNGNLVIDECELGGGDCNNDGLLDACQIILSEDDEFHLADCNDDGVADICGIAGLLDEVTGAAGRNFFQRNRNAGSTYQDMIAAYGRPWKRTAVPPTNSGLTPGSDPASRLRALNRFRTCSDALENVLPVLPELFAFEMLLGNEAFADALDPTIGLSGVDANDIGDRFAFEGIVDSLLDEELALLRGLSLPEGTNWLDRDVYYPPYGGQGLTHAAVYNRLPPNAAGGIAAAAYISNYGPGINNNFDAATRFPQGHGDAFGYYLKATKVYLEVFRGNPRDAALGEIDGVDDPQLGVTAQLAQNLIDHQPDDNEELLSGRLNDADLPYQSLRNMARAMAARARTALRIVEKTYRRDFTEDHASPAAGQLFQDSNPERAWAMADWARRGGLGAYFDWALTNQLLPSSPPELNSGFDVKRDSAEPTSCFDAYDGSCIDGSTFGDCDSSGGSPLAPGTTCDDIPETLPRVHRGTVIEVIELTSLVAEMQERVDTAGLGLNPLGLLANAVPFGINASELGEGTGRSPYEQVADAARDALSNARIVLEHANSANQRLREQAQDQTMFARQVEESAADFNNQLIDLFGYPSADDPADNDFDPSTSDLQEAGIEPGVTGGPDLVNFLLDVEERRWRERLAPGEIQLRLSEVEVAGTAVAQAKLAAQILVAEIEDVQQFREFLAQEGDDIDGIY
ncbi:MAG: hypothetical protein IH987_06490, partial [Planctomycetes bacterium]|nr:hypothetical protein [Planctomycetota bacterium]